MSIASEIARLQSAKSCIKGAIESKGVTVPNDLKLQGYGSCIDAIPSSAGCGSISMSEYSTQRMNGSLYSGDGTELINMNRGGDMLNFSIDYTTCNYMYMKIFKKDNGCKAQEIGCQFSVSCTRCTPGLQAVYYNKNNLNCYLIELGTSCNQYWRYGSGSCWCHCYGYNRFGIDISVPCISCVGNGHRLVTGACYGSCNCNSNPPSSEYCMIARDTDSGGGGTSIRDLTNCINQINGGCEKAVCCHEWVTTSSEYSYKKYYYK